MCALMCSYILAIYVNKVNILQQIFNQPACPALPPTPGQPCDVAPAGAQDCHYAGDHCCCGRCFSSFVFSCVLDVQTGNSTWQTSMCPSEGCGSSGEKISLTLHWITVTNFMNRCPCLAKLPRPLSELRCKDTHSSCRGGIGLIFAIYCN